MGRRECAERELEGLVDHVSPSKRRDGHLEILGPCFLYKGLERRQVDEGVRIYQHLGEGGFPEATPHMKLGQGTVEVEDGEASRHGCAPSYGFRQLAASDYLSQLA